MARYKQAWIVWDFTYANERIKGEKLIPDGRSQAQLQCNELNIIWGANSHKVEMRWPTHARIKR